MEIKFEFDRFVFSHGHTCMPRHAFCRAGNKGFIIKVLHISDPLP